MHSELKVKKKNEGLLNHTTLTALIIEKEHKRRANEP
jgi:hypothetical protein